MSACDGNNDFATVFEKDFCPVRTNVNNIIASGFVATFNGVTGGITIAGTSGITVAAQGNGSFLISSPGYGAPVDARAVSGSIMPDTNVLYDIGISGLRYGTIAAESGFFHRVQAPSGNLELMPGPGQLVKLLGTTNGALEIVSADGSDKIDAYHDGDSAHFETDDGVFYFENMESGIPSYIRMASSNSYAGFQFEYQGSVVATLDTGGGRNGLEFNYVLDKDIVCFRGCDEGWTPEWKLYGYRNLDARRSFEVGVGIDAPDTVSFDGLSNYLFDGNIIAGASGAYDLGTLATPWRTLNAVSGRFVPNSTQDVALEVSGVTRTMRVESQHIHPQADNEYDIGTYDPEGSPALAYRMMVATSGVFGSVVGASPLRLKDPNSECFVIVSGVSNEEIAIVPTQDASGYLGFTSQQWREVRTASGIFSNIGGNAGQIFVWDHLRFPSNTDLGTSAVKMGNVYAQSGTHLTSYTDALRADGGISVDSYPAIIFGIAGGGQESALAPEADGFDVIGTPSYQFNDIYASTKSFIMQHPLYSGLLIRYSAIEGPEAGAYVRGSGQLNNGVAIVPFGKQFHHVHDPEWTTVHVTPTQDCNGMYVSNVGQSGFVVRELTSGTSNAKFNWVAMTKRWDQKDEHDVLIPIDPRTTWKQMQQRYQRYKERLAKLGRVPKFVVPSGT